MPAAALVAIPAAFALTAETTVFTIAAAVGGAMGIIGQVTGSKELSIAGSVLGLAGGVGGLAEGAGIIGSGASALTGETVDSAGFASTDWADVAKGGSGAGTDPGVAAVTQANDSPGLVQGAQTASAAQNDPPLDLVGTVSGQPSPSIAQQTDPMTSLLQPPQTPGISGSPPSTGLIDTPSPNMVTAGNPSSPGGVQVGQDGTIVQGGDKQPGLSPSGPAVPGDASSTVASSPTAGTTTPMPGASGPVPTASGGLIGGADNNVTGVALETTPPAAGAGTPGKAPTPDDSIWDKISKFVEAHPTMAMGGIMSVGSFLQGAMNPKTPAEVSALNAQANQSTANTGLINTQTAIAQQQLANMQSPIPRAVSTRPPRGLIA